MLKELGLLGRRSAASGLAVDRRSPATTIDALVRRGRRAPIATRRARRSRSCATALSAGAVRAAEPDPSSPTGWRVNTWVKQGILLGFRFGDIVDVSMDHGALPFYDKDTLPLKQPGARRAASASCPADRRFATARISRRGVICMPPMYVNIGAYVGEGTLIDSHALVGSCAQIGARVHVSAAAQIGGVIEPVGALPVIVEDDVLVGGNTGIYEGAVDQDARGDRRRHGAHRIDAGLRPAQRRRSSSPTPGQPLVVPEGAVVVPGARAVTVGAGQRVGAVAGDAGDREVSRRRDRHAHGARSVDPVDAGRARAAQPRSTSIRRPAAKARRGAWLADYLRGRGYSRRSSSRSTTARFNVIAAVGEPPAVVFSTHFDCVPPFFPSRVEGGLLTAAAPCDAKGILAAQVAAAERLRAAGETRVGLLFVVGEERGSDGAQVANRIALDSRRFLINGEPTDNRLGAATRGILRVRLTRHRPRRAFVVPGARRIGDRQADRRADGAARRATGRRRSAARHARTTRSA